MLKYIFIETVRLLQVLLSDVDNNDCWPRTDWTSYSAGWSAGVSQIYQEVCQKHDICRAHEVRNLFINTQTLLLYSYYILRK